MVSLPTTRVRTGGASTGLLTSSRVGTEDKDGGVSRSCLGVREVKGARV